MHSNTGVIPNGFAAMKLLVFSFTLLLMLTCGEALECTHCIPMWGRTGCVSSVRTCAHNEDVCLHASFTIGPYSHFRRCGKRHQCTIYGSILLFKVHCCCDTDNCNARCM